MASVAAGWAVLLATGTPLFVLLGLAGWTFAALAGFPGIVVPQRIAMAANSFPLLAAPFFILMGNVMNAAGITVRIFAFARALTGWLRGGLCHANITASVIFAGMSGSAVADAGGLGVVEIKAMREAGYDAETAAAVTAASATIGPIIPPSLPMVIYGVMAETSIGGLFLGAVVPGLLMALALMVLVAGVARRRGLPREPFPGVRALARAAREALWAILAPVLLLAGMLGGVFTPTEAAAVAAFYALLVGLLVYREFRLSDLPRLVLDTLETTGVVMALVMTAALFAWCLSVSRLPQAVSAALVGGIGDPLLFLLLLNLVLLVVGCVMEAIAAILLLVPIFVPPALALGIDPVQLGVVFVLNLMIGTITPPVGVVLFVTANVARLPFETVARAVLPFLVPLLLVLLAITLVPALTTWLPGLLIGR
jgi:tripartite ATP-independent transporter DctM subunit